MDTNLEQPITAARRGTIFQNDMASDQSHLKTELALLQRKYERLASKEKRMQVIGGLWFNPNHKISSYNNYKNLDGYQPTFIVNKRKFVPSSHLG